MLHSETNLLKFELGISNDLSSLLYLPLVSGDNNFICRSLDAMVLSIQLRFSMINKVATTHCSFLRLQIKREDISTNAVSLIKTEVYSILRDVCIVSRDVCIVSNRLTCIDSKLSEMEILAQPLSLPFIIENLKSSSIVSYFTDVWRKNYFFLYNTSLHHIQT
jgi:hypothetical protein